MKRPSKWIRIVPYDPAWPAMFQAEADQVRRVFEGVRCSIEHVGSTAVQGLAAKPIIDIIAGFDALHDVETRLRNMEAIGYQYVPEYEAELPRRRYFRKPVGRPSRYHLHAVEMHSRFWVSHLLFRDFLRQRPDWAREYYHLKVSLAEEFRTNGPAYTEGKSDFVERALEEARLARPQPLPHQVGESRP